MYIFFLYMSFSFQDIQRNVYIIYSSYTFLKDLNQIVLNCFTYNIYQIIYVCFFF